MRLNMSGRKLTPSSKWSGKPTERGNKPKETNRGTSISKNEKKTVTRSTVKPNTRKRVVKTQTPKSKPVKKKKRKHAKSDSDDSTSYSESSSDDDRDAFSSYQTPSEPLPESESSSWSDSSSSSSSSSSDEDWHSGNREIQSLLFPGSSNTFVSVMQNVINFQHLPSIFRSYGHNIDSAITTILDLTGNDDDDDSINKPEAKKKPDDLSLYGFDLPPAEQNESDAPPTMTNDMICTICMSRPRCVMADPCGHFCMCVTCAREIVCIAITKGETTAPCPICKVPFTKAKRVFFS